MDSGQGVRADWLVLPATVENVLLFVLLRIQQDDNTPEHQEVSTLATFPRFPQYLELKYLYSSFGHLYFLDFTQIISKADFDTSSLLFRVV